MQPNLLKLGDELDGTIIKAKGGRRFLVKCPRAPRQWKVELHTRRPELIQEGAHAHFWVAKIVPEKQELLVHDGDYGRLPISDAMRPRYLAGLRALLGEGDVTADALADVRAMVLQISKKQQADWLSVWKVLGEPTSGDAKGLIVAIDALRTARKEDPEALPGLHVRMKDRYGEVLQRAIRRLERS
ncbi:MAG: hypothetical protein ACO1SV_09410 [Fimbriimonas sp.]